MISSRLTKIAELIKNDHDVADIGSDHGLLLILLNNRKFPKKVLGVENKVGPYKNLEKTVLSINNPNFSSNLSSGLKKVDINYQTIVIAGMGFATIKEIVLDDIKKGHKRETFIIDCHTNQNEVRSFFYELGYKIENEVLIYEDKIYYDIIKFVLNNDNTVYSNLELTYGPYNIKRKSDVFLKMCSEKIEKLENIFKLVTDDRKRTNLLNEISILKEFIHEN